MAKRLVFWMLAAMGCLTGVQANAQDEAFKYELMQNHNVSQPAQMRVIALVDLNEVKVTVTNCGDKEVVQKFNKIQAGKAEVLSWMQPAGSYKCDINISAFPNTGEQLRFNATHEFNSMAPLSVEADLRELRPDLSKIQLKATRPVMSYSVTVLDGNGEKIDSVEKQFSLSKEFSVEWKPNGKRPAIIDIWIGDGKGAYATYSVVYLNIPHRDIVFESAKSEIAAEQEPFLQESLDKINDILKKYSKVVVDLYITGHTDTVGSAASNDKLSRERAKAIAAWFRAHDLSLPIYYRGVGERGLAVPTEDETPNEENRRAVYILSNSPPAETPSLGGWDKLP